MSPERSIEIQGLLGSDIQMQLDECVALAGRTQGDRARHGNVVALGRALQGRLRRPAGQGDVRHRAGRRRCRLCASARPQALSRLDLKGYAIGGLAVGEPQDVMLDMLDITLSGTADREAALPDGRRHAGRYPEIRGARHRHVRLRHADPLRPPRPGLHPARQGQYPQCPPRRGHASARRAVRMPGVTRLFARLSAPSRARQRERSAACC